MKHLFRAVGMSVLLVLSIIATSCGQSKSSSNLKGYEWLEGRWENTEEGYLTTKVILTPTYIQYTSMDEETDVSSQPKLNYVIKINYEEMLHEDLKAICVESPDGEFWPAFYINEVGKNIFFLYDFDMPMALTKIQ